MAELRPRALARLALQVAIALAIFLGVEALAHLPLGAPPRGAAIRLAIRTAAGRIEVCREVPPEELAALPIHMRQPRICNEEPVAYRLILAVDGAVVHSVRAHRRGMRGDRPLVMDDLVEIAAGRHTIEATFEPEIPAGTAGAAVAALPRGELRSVLDLPSGRIALVTWEPLAGLTVRQ